MKIPDPWEHPLTFVVAIGLASVLFYLLIDWFLPDLPPREIYIHFDTPLTIHIEQEPK